MLREEEERRRLEDERRRQQEEAEKKAAIQKEIDARRRAAPRIWAQHLRQQHPQAQVCYIDSDGNHRDLSEPMRVPRKTEPVILYYKEKVVQVMVRGPSAKHQLEEGEEELVDVLRRIPVYA